MKKIANAGMGFSNTKAYEIGAYSKKKGENNYGLALAAGLGTGATSGAVIGGISRGITGRSPLLTLKSFAAGNPPGIIEPGHLKSLNVPKAIAEFSKNVHKGLPAQSGAFVSTIE